MSEKDCETIFFDLLKTEMYAIGLGGTTVTVSSPHVSDGGIDARVDYDLSDSHSSSLIKGKCPSYQVKSGESFKPSRQSVIYGELFVKNAQAKKENLKPEILRCLENGYPYVLVCMKVRLDTKKRQDAIDHITDAFGVCGFNAPTIDVLGQDQVLDHLNKFPSLALRVNGRDSKNIATHKEWGMHREMKHEIHMGSEQKQMIDKLQTTLRQKSKKPVHFHIWGETGIGKTRLVLEATRDDKLSPLVVYCNSPRTFYEMPLNELRRGNVTAILVIDEYVRNDIWDRIQELDSDIKLVSISNESRRIESATPMSVPKLSDNEIQRIMLGYGVDEVTCSKLAPQCGGIPRLAHMAGTVTTANIGDVFYEMPKILEKYVAFGDPSREDVRRKKVILLTLALFKRFGQPAYFKAEYDAVFNIVKKIADVDMAFFADTIDYLKDRKILQGEEILYLTPKLLHVWLWAEWWRRYGDTLGVGEILKDIPETLETSFYAMFEYVTQSNAAKKTLDNLFGESGPLRDSDILGTDSGSKLFHALSKVTPHTAVARLENAMKRLTTEQMRNLTEGRRHVVYGLERIMFEPDLFVRGGRLLLRLAEAENEVWSNNATATFCGMFSLGAGRMSNTRAAPRDRLPLLRDTLCEDDPARRSLGLLACKSALTVPQYSISSLAYDDIESEPDGWKPVNTLELKEAYCGIIEMMCKKIKTLPVDAGLQTATIILDASRMLLRNIPEMDEYLIDKIHDLRSVVGGEKTLDTVMQIREFERDWLDSALDSRLERLEISIQGRSYDDRMRRYVKMSPMIDMYEKTRERSRIEKIRELAGESMDASKLRPHLDWLVTLDAKDGYLFGHELSILDTNRALLEDILGAQRHVRDNGSGFFLSGYMLGVLERDLDRWNVLMREIATDKKLSRFAVEVACRSGITEEVGSLISDLVRDGRIPAADIARMPPAFPRKPSSQVTWKWIRALIDDGSLESVCGALQMFYLLFTSNNQNHNDVRSVLDLLTCDVLFDDRDWMAARPMAAHAWNSIATEMIGQYPDESTRLCGTILENADTAMVLHSQSYVGDVLERAASVNPDRVWEMATRYITGPLDERGYVISHWLRGRPGRSDGILTDVTPGRVLKWVAEDSEYRAPYMARYVPPVLADKSIAMDLVREYGGDNRVSDRLLSNFMSGTFSGSAVEHYAKIKRHVLEYKATVSNMMVIGWLDSYLDALTKTLEQWKVYEKQMLA